MFDNFILIIALIWHSIKHNIWALIFLIIVLVTASFFGGHLLKADNSSTLLKCYDRVLEKKGSISQADKDECKELVDLLS